MNNNLSGRIAAEDTGPPHGTPSPSSDGELETLLKGVLETIIHLPWLGANAGGIFLNSPERQELELVAHINFTPYIAGTCSRVPHGLCLCGRVAQSKRLLHTSCVDHDHDIRYPGMKAHGHYVIPVTDGDDLAGVMVLYVDHGHRFDDDEAKALHDFATTISLIIRAHRQKMDMELARLILANSDHGVLVTDAQLRIQWVNRTFEKTTGYTRSEVIGKSPSILKSGRHPPSFYAAMWATIASRGHWQGEVWNRRKNGEIYPEMLNILALRDDGGKVARYAAMFIDLSEIYQARERIHRLAYFDRLTGLPNAEKLAEDLEALLNNTLLANRDAVLLHLDLDHFHEINANLGRRAGDATLKEVARRIGQLEGHEIAARIGADEFILAYTFPHGESESALEQANRRARNLQRRLSVPFHFESQELNLECSIGLAEADLSSDTPDALLRRAIVATRHAKRHRPRAIVTYDAEIGREAALTHHIIRRLPSLSHGEGLYLLYQPKIGREGELMGAEVLLRWRDRVHGDISPERFIRCAEEHGAIVDIGLWVFVTALRRLSEWRVHLRENRKQPFLAINVSPLQLMVRQMARRFIGLCEEYGIPPSMIEIEVTETGITKCSDTIGPNLDQLSEAGFHIAIDDFGTGHSSLSRLHHYPLDTLKIDRSFVTSMQRGPSSVAIVQSIVDMAHTLGCRVVAEGIESARQYRMLHAMGCDLFQGYLFDRPLKEEDFLDRLRHRENGYPLLITQ